MKKNVTGQKIGAQLVSATDGTAFTGSVTVSVTGDAGTQATGSVGSGACTHEGNGYHTYAPAQAETNYDLIAFTFTGSGAIPVTVQVYTSFPQTGDAFVTAGNVETDTQDIQARLPAALVGGRIDANAGAISGDATAADNAEAFFDGTGYAGTGNVIPSVTTVTGNVNGSVGSVTGAVGSVTGAVGSVTGNVGGNVTGSVGSLAAQAKLDVNAEVDSALDTAIPGTPTADSINERVKTMDDADLPGDVAAVKSDTAAILVDTGTDGVVVAASSKTGYAIGVGGIGTTAIDTNAIHATALATGALDDIRDAVAALAMVQPSAVPAVTATLKDTLSWLLALSRNKVTQTATTQTLRNDADDATIAASTHSDDGTTHTRGEFA
jgi:hypothetical protein